MKLLRGISIHAPREGGDCTGADWRRRTCDFNPRPPRGGRHQGQAYDFIAFDISIHAPREGGDVLDYIGVKY